MIRTQAPKGATSLVVAVSLVLLATAASSACIGYGRHRSDEFDARLAGRRDDPDDRYYDDDDYGAYDRRDFDSDDDWDREPEPAKETLVEHRTRPVVDPGSQRSAEDGPLAYLAMLQEELADTRLSGYALMWEDARLFRTAELDGSSRVGRLGYRPDHWRAGGGRVIPVRVIEDHGRAVEIETISREEARRHCDGGVRRSLDAYKLRAFVPRSELVPVVAKEIEQEYEDGSVAHAPPGVAIRPTENALLLRLAGGAIEVPARPDRDQIALSYDEPGFPEGRLGHEPMSEQLDPAAPLSLAGRPVQLRMLSGDAGRPRWVREDHGGGGSRVLMGDRCIAVVVTSEDPNPVAERVDAGFGLSGLSGGSSSADYRYEVRGGATVMWPDGERAGVTRKVAMHSEEPERIDGLQCFTLMGVVKVCHDPSDVSYRDQSEISDVTGIVSDDDAQWGEDIDEDEDGLVEDPGGRMVEESPGMWVIESEENE